MSEMPAGYIDVPAEFAPDGVMAFRVQGECLAGDHIHDGDWVLADPAEPVADGDICVVRSKRGPLVKHLHRDGAAFRMVPSNPDFSPVILTPEDDPVVVGRVSAIVRYLEFQKP
jgi:SOS-response transcriptional repressor LexA